MPETDKEASCCTHTRTQGGGGELTLGVHTHYTETQGTYKVVKEQTLMLFKKKKERPGTL